MYIYYIWPASAHTLFMPHNRFQFAICQGSLINVPLNRREQHLRTRGIRRYSGNLKKPYKVDDNAVKFIRN